MGSTPVNTFYHWTVEPESNESSSNDRLARLNEIYVEKRDDESINQLGHSRPTRPICIPLHE